MFASLASADTQYVSTAEIALSFAPRQVLRRTFPPIVCGVTVLCIGIALAGVGIKYWGGGAFCADNRFPVPCKQMRVDDHRLLGRF